MKHLLFIMISLCTIAISCTKEGPAGKDGINGKDGVNGVDGKDGTTIYSGQGAPTATIGKVGDYYIDFQNSKLFGPKSASSWGSGFNMKGADGINGEDGTNGTNGINGRDGNSILSGYGLPTATIGNIGDYYMDKGNYLLFGPKTINNGWGAGLLLKGQDGTNGKDGNANVRTYIISNPWKFYDTANPSKGLFQFFPTTGVFTITSSEVDYGLVLAFFESTPVYGGPSKFWSQAGTTHSNYYGVNFNSSFEIYSYNNYIIAFLRIGKNVLRNDGTNGDWTDMEEAKSMTGILRIKIIVIPQSSLSVLGYRKGTIKEKDIKAIVTRFIDDNK